MVTAENLRLALLPQVDENEQEDLLGQVERRKKTPMKVLETTQRQGFKRPSMVARQSLDANGQMLAMAQ